MTDFADARPEIDEALPAWWAHRRPGSAVDDILAVCAALADALGDEMQQIFDDQFLATASTEALRTEWGPLYGAAAEDLDENAGNLRAYLQELASDDGSAAALARQLLKLLSTPANIAAHGEPHLFGLHFPADGSGLHFPGDGSGLHFPGDAWVAVIEGFSTYTLEVEVLGALEFDRAAFARAVQRARQAHTFPPTITEI